MTAEPAPVDTAGRHWALALAVRHINASTPVAIPDAELLAILQAGAAPGCYAHHLHAFLDETDVETISDLVISGAVTYGQLAGLADRHLAASHPIRRWLDERRGL